MGAAAGVAEAAADVMTAAMDAVTGTTRVDFVDSKDKVQSIGFQTKPLGFKCQKPKPGCCTAAPKAPVVVGAVDKNSEAEKMGVKKDWGIRSINGTQVNAWRMRRSFLRADA